MNDEIPKICSTCHWWFKPDVVSGCKGMCVLHTGLKGCQTQKVFFGGKVPLQTDMYFGCNQWKENERKPQCQS